MSLTVWEYNGGKFEFDISDADMQERLYNAKSNLEEANKTIQKAGPDFEILRAQYKMYVAFFDDLFGSGKGVEVIGQKANVRICVEAFLSFADFCNVQKESMLKYQQKINRYTPNRAQRRDS